MAGGFQPGAFQGNAFQGAQQGGVVRLSVRLDAPIASRADAVDDALFALALRRRQLNNRKPVGLRIRFDAPIERFPAPPRMPRPRPRVPVRLELSISSVVREHVVTRLQLDAPVHQLVHKAFSFDAPIVDFYDQSVDVLLAEIDPDLLFWLGSPAPSPGLQRAAGTAETIEVGENGPEPVLAGSTR